MTTSDPTSVPVSAPARCKICGWTLAATVREGCVEGNCSYRPDDPAERKRISARRALIAEGKDPDASPSSIDLLEIIARAHLVQAREFLVLYAPNGASRRATSVLSLMLAAARAEGYAAGRVATVEIERAGAEGLPAEMAVTGPEADEEDIHRRQTIPPTECRTPDDAELRIAMVDQDGDVDARAAVLRGEV